MAKKDKKGKMAEHKARVIAKQGKKAAQKEKKTNRRGDDELEDHDCDLDAQLEEYARQQAQFLHVTETSTEPPSARSASTILASPANAKELFIFGGEAFDGTFAHFFNDLYVYHVERDEFRIVTSPNSPLPRSGHAWCRGGNAGGIYLFGGEFSSPKQGTFHHYNDFWHLDPQTREWTRLETKGKSPSARSGHRMTFYKNYIILFGGFQDTSQQTKYLQDLWIYDCQQYVWHNPTLSQASQKPDARSSFSLLPHDSGAVLYGGYSRVKASTVISGKSGRSNNSSVKQTYVPKVHEDSWFLRFSTGSSSGSVDVPFQVRWERRKKPANAPSPVRAGVTQVHHKGRGILFGGVHDIEDSEEGIESEFFDQLYAWNIDRNRFFPLNLRRSRMPQRRQIHTRSKRQRGEMNEKDLLENLASIERRGQAEPETKTPEDVDEMDVSQLDDDTKIAPTKSVSLAMPHRRYNAQLAVVGDILFIFGGTFERGDREFNLDEMHCIDLGKLDGVTEIFSRTLPGWDDVDAQMSDGDDEDDEEEDEDLAMSESDSEDGESHAREGGVTLPVSTIPLEKAQALENSSAKLHSDLSEAANDEVEDSTAPLADSGPHPRPFENLRDFFARTSTQWQEFILEKMKYPVAHGASVNDYSVKEIRKMSFDMAETKWWDCREEIGEEEQRQEEAGIGEIVNLALRSHEDSAHKRR